jgi:Leucine-rich repeat (LRR) protein
LDLSENYLEGVIPPELEQLRNLMFLGLANNQITGAIPESIGNISTLVEIDLVVKKADRISTDVI